MISRRFVVTSLCAMLLAAPRPTAAEGTPGGQSPIAAVARSEQQAMTEQWWIVNSVLRALVDMAGYGRTAGAAAQVVARDEWAPGSASRPTNRYTVTVDTRPLNALVDLQRHVWDPASYSAVAAELLGTAHVEREFRPESILSELADARPSALVELNTRVSAMLAGHFRSPAAHQQAALLLGAFALREASGPFMDHRPALNRMTAHLAAARGLDASVTTLDGRVAEVILLAVIGRQVDARHNLDAIRAELTAARQDAWARVLALRICDDWRTPPATSASLLERLEYVRAVRARTTVSRSLTALDSVSQKEQELPEWGRLAAVDGMDVETGNRFAVRGLGSELADIEKAWGQFHQGQPTPAQLIADLNVMVSRGPVGGALNGAKVSVIDWTLWAGYFQRNLCDWLSLVSLTLRNLGLPEDRTEWNASADEALGNLRLYPLVLAVRAKNAAEYDLALQRGRPLIGQTPQLVPDGIWRVLANGQRFQRPIADLVPETIWFVPMVPLGTSYDLRHRAWSLVGGKWTLGGAQVAAMHAMAPFKFEPIWEDLCQKYGDPSPHPPSAVVRRAFAAFSAYNSETLGLMLTMVDGEAEPYVEISDTRCALDADTCGDFGQYLLDLGRRPEAAAAYERLVADARDRVGVSNEVDWLVRYYHDTGRQDRALQLAAMAAETYSSRGLLLHADELDRLGRQEEAEAIYKKNDERYKDQSLAEHYFRKAYRAGSFSDPRIQPLIADVFGGTGVTRVSAPPKVGPKKGVLVTALGPTGFEGGLQLHDVIVALDGWRVQNWDQYDLLKSSAETDVMELLIWRDHEYVTVRATVPQRTWSVRVQNYAGGPIPVDDAAARPPGRQPAATRRPSSGR